MTAALRCACALALAYLVSLLLLPEGAQGEGLQVQQSPEPRAASWHVNFGPLNKYVEKFFKSSPKKSKNQKKTVSATKSPSSSAKKPSPPNATKRSPPNTTKPSPPNAAKPQPAEPQGLQPSTSSLGSR